MAHHELALHAVNMGVDVVPDSVWHKIPYFRPSKKDKSKEEQKKAEKGAAQPSRHHHRRRSEGQDIKHSKDTRRRAHSSSPYASDSSDDGEHHEGYGRKGRSRRQSRYDSAYAAGYNHGASMNAAQGLHVNTGPFPPSSLGHGYNGPSSAGAAPSQYPIQPPHPVSLYLEHKINTSAS